MATPALAAARIGRPRIYPERLADYLTVTCTPGQRLQLEERARKAGKPLAAYARELLLAATA